MPEVITRVEVVQAVVQHPELKLGWCNNCGHMQSNVAMGASIGRGDLCEDCGVHGVWHAEQYLYVL